MIVVVPVTLPADTSSSSRFAAQSSFSDGDRTHLYEAAVRDTVRAAAASGGDLLVNYREAREDAGHESASDPPDAVRELVATALGTDADVRFERQVGSTRSGRIGNTVTHLLERESVSSVGVLDPTAPLVERTQIDAAAMALRRNDVVLGPGTGGSVYLSAFSTPIDFTDAYRSTPLSRIAQLSEAAGLQTGFVPAIPTLDSGAGLSATAAWIEARDAAGRPIPEATAAVLDGLDFDAADASDSGDA